MASKTRIRDALLATLLVVSAFFVVVAVNRWLESPSPITDELPPSAGLTMVAPPTEAMPKASVVRRAAPALPPADSDACDEVTAHIDEVLGESGQAADDEGALVNAGGFSRRYRSCRSGDLPPRSVACLDRAKKPKDIVKCLRARLPKEHRIVFDEQLASLANLPDPVTADVANHDNALEELRREQRDLDRIQAARAIRTALEADKE